MSRQHRNIEGATINGSMCGAPCPLGGADRIGCGDNLQSPVGRPPLERVGHPHIGNPALALGALICGLVVLLLAIGATQESESVGASVAAGQTVYYVDDDSAGGNGLNWSNAFRYLQDALAVAVAGDEIRVAQGTYKPDRGGGHTPGDDNATFVLNDDVALYGGFAGVGSADPNQRDVAAYETTLSGDLADNDGSHTLLDFINCLGGPPLQSGCDVFDSNKNGQVGENDFRSWWNANGGGENSGGIVYLAGTGPDVVLDGFTVTAAKWWAGVSTWGQGVFSGTIANCTVFNNWGQDVGGGIILAREGGSPTITNCTIMANYTDGIGSLYAYVDDIEVTDCTFTANRGGFRLNSGMATVTGCAFNENREGSSVWNDGRITLIDCVFSGNSSWEGGGMYNGGTAATLVNCVFSGNTATAGDGGGMYNVNAFATLINCTFIGNRALGQSARGGAIAIVEASSDLINCTFIGNSADGQGGAVGWLGGGEMTNCIFWQNSSPEISNPGDFNITYTSSECSAYPGIGNICGDPIFADVHGRLAPGSPCIDAGNSTALPLDTLDLDGDGDTTERIPVDFDGNPRFVDDPDTIDTGVPDPPDYPEVVDMGAYEYLIDCNENHIPDWVDIANGTSQDCHGNGIPDDCELEEDCNYNGIPDDCDVDDDGDGIPDDCLLGLAGEITPPPAIAAMVDFARTAEDLDSDGFPDAVVPPTAAFYQPTENKLYGNEPGSMTVNWLDAAGEALLPEPTPYSISALPHPADNVIGTSYFLDQQVGSAAAGVPIESPFTVTIHLNATIREADPSQGETLDDAYIQQGTNAFQVSDDVVPGWVVLEYTDQIAGGPLRGFEVVHIWNLGFVDPEEVAIGRKLTLPQDADECRAMLLANGDAGGAVAWQRGAGVENTADIWPIRPLTNANLFRVIWYRGSHLGSGEDLGNCWPVAVSAHTIRWPNPALGDAPVQTHVLDTSDPSRGPIVDLRIKKGTETSDLYCDGTVEYQEGFTAGDPSPGAVIDDDGLFTTANEGYSVIRFTQPEGDGSCGIGTALPTTFEVVGSSDHLDEGTIARNRAGGVVSVFAGTFDASIGTSIENAAEHDFDTPHYPYGYLHDGLGYAVTTYEPFDAPAQPNPDYTGQIIPVNVSSFPDGANAHGLLEVWYFQESRATDNGDYGGGIFWPGRVYRYDADWPVTTAQIVIADQDGAPCDDATYCPGGAYPPTSQGSKVYAGGTFGSQGVQELNTAGWNPNDEHAILQEGRVYAVRATTTPGASPADTPTCSCSIRSSSIGRRSMWVREGILAPAGW